MILYLIRGLPGSGKSTYAKKLGCLHLEADMYHVKNGVYKFDLKRLKAGHDWCQMTTWQSMQHQSMDIVVSNTFTQKRELQPYLELAKMAGYEVKIVRLNSAYGSIHSVPEDVLQKMKDRFENIDGEEIVG